MQLLCKYAKILHKYAIFGVYGHFSLFLFPFFFAPLYYIVPIGLQLLDNQRNTAGVMSRGNVFRLPPLPPLRYDVAQLAETQRFTREGWRGDFRLF